MVQALVERIAQHKQGQAVGITSICSSHPWVIDAAMMHALAHNQLLLLEATSNQVDQYGGYTGMTPQAFSEWAQARARDIGLPADRLILGGDHLGPNRWQHLPAAEAMDKAGVLIEHYVAAGFKKIHLDCSMACADDVLPLSDEQVAERAARLATVAERVCQQQFAVRDVLYVIGTEVPVPGGAKEQLEPLTVTSTAAARYTLRAHQMAFEHAGLSDIWSRVIGLVVQPGVEFDHSGVVDYQGGKTAGLSAMIADFPHLVYEAHSTDYQLPAAYKELVSHHFAILKVGPALTFALREALYALEDIERELFGAAQRSRLREHLEQAMLAHPDYWQPYYHGTAKECAYARHFSYSDRIRYYWTDARVQSSCQQLIDNLTRTAIPLPLLSQYLPDQYRKVRARKLDATPRALVLDRISQVIACYSAACH